MGGIAGSNVYFAREAPKYHTGFGSCMAFSTVGAITAILLRFAYDHENKKRDRLLAELGEDGVRAKHTEQELLDMGDRSPFFRYAL